MSSIRVYLLNKANRLGYSDDLCATISPCGTTNLTPYLITREIASKKTDLNFVIAVGTFGAGDQGIIYSTDGGNTFTQSGGSWISSGGSFTKVCISPNDENIIYATVQQGIVAKSIDGGLTFSSVGTTSSISGLPPGASTRSVYSTNGVDVVVSINTNVYYSNDGGTSWNIVGAAVDGVDEPAATYVDDGGNLFLAVTKNGVFSSTGGAWSSVFAFPSPLVNAGRVVLSYAGANTFYTADAVNLFYTTDNFTTATPVYTVQDVTDGIIDIEFYSTTSGFIVDQPPTTTIIGARTIDSFTNNIPYSDTANIFTNASRLAIGTDANSCGCPPGFIYNTSSQLCESTTSVCPDGFTYNASTNTCVGPPLNCKMDLTLVVDASSSINSNELTNLKAFLIDLVDGINGANGENRIVSGDVQIGIVRFNNGLETAGTQNILDLSGGPNAWQSSPTGGSIKQTISNFAVYQTGATNTLSGLSDGYDNITGINNRNSDPTVTRRILFITDGFPSWAYGPDAYQIDPGPPQVLNSGDYNGIFIANTTLGGINSIDANYQTYRCDAYRGAMDLAQNIKSGSGSTSVDCAITLMIIGENSGNGSIEYYATRDALVGNTGGTSGITNPTWSTTPCSFTTAPLFGGTIDWSCTYGPSLNRFCSNNALGDPDYFMSLFDSASLAAIKNNVLESLLCPNIVPALSCNNPCTLNTTTGQCLCTNGTDYIPCCYDLINCADGSIYASLNTDSSAFNDLAQYVGSVVVFEGLPECLFVVVTESCDNTTTIDTINITETFINCQECQEALEINPCYKLTNCNNGDVFLMSYQDLSQFSGLVVELAEYPGLCWTVLKTYNCVGEFTTVSIVQSYPDCECCFQYQCV
jgi:hypothetical protein